jgi:hypothetical protein
MLATLRYAMHDMCCHAVFRCYICYAPLSYAMLCHAGFAGWLGWLAGLAGWLAGLAGWLAGWLAVWLRWLASWLVSLAGWLRELDGLGWPEAIHLISWCVEKSKLVV